MTRDQARDRLMDYAYGELSRGEAEAFEEVLREDPELRHELDAIRLVREASAGLQRPELPAMARHRILLAARAESHKRAILRRWEGLQRLFLSPVFLGAAAVIVAVGVGVHLILTQGTEDSWSRIDREQRVAVLSQGEPSPAEGAAVSPAAPGPAAEEEALGKAASAEMASTLATAAPADRTAEEKVLATVAPARGAKARPAKEMAGRTRAATGDDGVAGILGGAPQAGAWGAGGLKGGGGGVATGSGAGIGSTGYGRAAPAREQVAPRPMAKAEAPGPAPTAAPREAATVPLGETGAYQMLDSPDGDRKAAAQDESLPARKTAERGDARRKTAAREDSGRFAAPPPAAASAPEPSSNGAESASTTAARVPAESPADLVDLARELRAAGYLVDALAAYRRALTAGPTGDLLADALAEAAEVARELGQNAQADAFLSRLEKLPGGVERAAKIRSR